MMNKFLKKTKFKKNTAWIAKEEARILFTALASVATHKLLKGMAKRYPKLGFLKET